MAYSNNPNLPRARAIALRLLIVDRLPSSVVANKCGVHRALQFGDGNKNGSSSMRMYSKINQVDQPAKQVLFLATTAGTYKH